MVIPCPAYPLHSRREAARHAAGRRRAAPTAPAGPMLWDWYGSDPIAVVAVLKGALTHASRK